MYSFFTICISEGIDLNAISQAMVQSGMLSGAGSLDAQTIAALAVGGVQPNALGMLGMQPDLMGVSGVPGLPTGISPMAMLQALQVNNFYI